MGACVPPKYTICEQLVWAGGLAIQNEIGLIGIGTFARLGATSMTLTHSASIDWVDSSTDVERWGGLNELGRQVIRPSGTSTPSERRATMP